MDSLQAGKDVPEPQLAMMVSANPGQVLSVSISPDGRRALIVGNYNYASLWDLESGMEVLRLQGVTGFSAACFTPDGTHALTATGFSALLWDLDSGRMIRTLSGHTDQVLAVAISPDGKEALTGGRDKSVRLWDLESGTQKKQLDKHSASISSLCFSPDGQSALTASYDKSAILWDLGTGQPLRTLSGHSNWVHSVAFSPDGNLGLTASLDETVRIWSLQTGQEAKRFVGSKSGAVFCARFTPDGKHLVTANNDGSARVLDLASGREVRQLKEHKGLVLTLALSPDGKQLLTGSYDQTAILWDLASGRPQRQLRGRISPTQVVALTPGGESLLVAGKNSALGMFDLQSGGVAKSLKGQRSEIRTLTISSDGTFASTGSASSGLSPESAGAASVWNLGSGRELHTFVGTAFNLGLVALSPNGESIVTAARDRSVRLFSVASKREIWAAKGHEDLIGAVCFSPDGSLVASGGINQDSSIRIWHADTGRELKRFTLKTGNSVQSLCFSPDNKRILAGCSDRTARLLDIESSAEVLCLTGHTSNVYSVAFVGNSNRALTGSGDQTARLWDLSTGQTIKALLGHSAPITSVCASGDGKQAWTSSTDQAVRLWDLDSGKSLCSVYTLNDGAWAVVDSESRYDASNGGDIAGLHWIFTDPQSRIREPIALHQFKDLFYDPGLLAKHLKKSPEAVRQIPSARSIRLYPSVTVQLNAQAQSAHVELRERGGGGIGAFRVMLNGSTVYEGYAPPKVDRHSFDLDISKFANRLVPKSDLLTDQGNVLEVLAFNGANSLLSRGVKVEIAAPEARVRPPKLHIVAVGCSDYEGEALDLRYAANDAIAFSNALKFAASNLLGPDRVESRVLVSTDGPTSYEKATSSNIRTALSDLKQKASATDIVVLYLSGHGVSRAGDDVDYFYLTTESGLVDLSRRETRDRMSISGEELADRLAEIPANKKVLILDTCAAGAASPDITKGQDVGSDIRRAWERLKDHAGVFVLAGCASNSVSYEATNVRQGLLTYSLLEPISKVDPLVLKMTSEGNFQLDVMPWLYSSEQRVGELIRELGLNGNQKPELKPAANAQSFPIGQLKPEDAGKVVIEQPKSVVLLRDLEDSGREDPLNLTVVMDEALKRASADGKLGLIYWPSIRDHPAAYVLTGEYQISGSQITLDVFVQAYVKGADGQRSRRTVGRVATTGTVAKIKELCSEALTKVAQLVAKEP